jgi:hypothetical protein
MKEDEGFFNNAVRFILDPRLMRDQVSHSYKTRDKIMFKVSFVQHVIKHCTRDQLLSDQQLSDGKAAGRMLRDVLRRRLKAFVTPEKDAVSLRS